MGFFNKCNLYLSNNMNRLQKLLMLSKDQGHTTDSSAQVVETSAVAVADTLCYGGFIHWL